MSQAVEVVRYLLANSAGLTATVPAASIVAGVIPQGVQPPALGIRSISDRRHQTVKGGESNMRFARVTVTMLVEVYADLKTVAALVRAALPRSRGTVNGTAVDSIVDDIEGPDLPVGDAGFCERSMDFFVTYYE